MMLFKTISGSLYEVNHKEKQIRRISNENNLSTTARQTEGWKLYESITDIKVGNPVLICWNKSNTPLFSESPNYAKPATLTSVVVEVN